MGAIEEANKDVVRKLLATLTRSDVEPAKDLYADDFELWTPGSLPFSGTHDKAAALKGIPEVLGLFPDGLTFSIRDMTAEGDRVAVEAVSDGVTAKGIRYQQQYHFLITVRDGKIRQLKEYMDTELARAVLVEGREPR